MYWVCYNDDAIDVRNTNSLVNTISYGKELCFSGRYVDSMVICLDSWAIIWVDVWNQGCNVDLYACVRNNYKRQKVRGCLDSNIIKFV